MFYFPEYENYGELNKEVTIKHLLEMSNGMVVKNERTGSMLSPFLTANSKKSLEMLLQLPIKEELFNSFSYNTLTAFLLKEKIEFYNLENLCKKYKLPLKSFSCDSHWSDEAHNNIAKLIKIENII